jgi:delta-aminolevulinic acid dehydratase/porphobilinogen synthase
LRRLRPLKLLNARSSSTGQLVAPVFVVPGRGRRKPIPSITGHERLSPDLVVEYARRLARLRIGGLLLFGVPDTKDDRGDGAADPAGPVPEALRLLAGAELPTASLDEAGHAGVAIIAYASKHASSSMGRFARQPPRLPASATAAVPPWRLSRRSGSQAPT